MNKFLGNPTYVKMFIQALNKLVLNVLHLYETFNIQNIQYIQHI